MKELALTVGNYPIQTPKDIGIFSLQKLVQWGITLVIVVSVLLTLFFLISGGIDMITSGGDKQKVVNARHKLTFAIVGLIIVFLSFFIVNTTQGIFGIRLGNQCLGGNCLTP